MAATTSDWYEKLKFHSISKRLKDVMSRALEKQSNTNVKSLLAVKNGDLFVWDSFNANILYCNLKSLLSVSTEHDDEEKNYHYHQVLVSADSGRFEVEDVTLNSNNTHLAVWGPRGIEVFQLPQRWGKRSQFEGGKETVYCKTVKVASRQLSGNQYLQVRQVMWHPGSPSHTHIAVLTSDNNFSVYLLTEPDQAVSSCCLQCPEPSSSFISPTKLNISAALGETVAAFTFGPSQELMPIKRPFQAPDQQDILTVWPVYISLGNGDIMITYSEVNSNRPLRLPVHGPLVMSPAAEDNYGVDACSILCLDTFPPIVVIATCGGSLHHCLILSSSKDNNGAELTLAPDMPKYFMPAEPSVYVVETVELELSLCGGNRENLADISDSFTCPIHLLKDPVSLDRYHCSHSAGIHSVALPWIHALHTFLISDFCEFVMPDEQESVVEHLLCTKPLFISPSAPVLGLDIVSDPSLTPTLLALTSDGDFTPLPMSNKYRNPWSGFLQESETTEGLSTSVRHSAAPFSEHLARVLHRNISNPLLRATANTEISQAACYQLLTRVTQVLREEYVQKQEHAQHEMEARVQILIEQKQQQMEDLCVLQRTKDQLRDKARQLGERLQGCLDSKEELLVRLEMVTRKIQSRIPLLSLAEKQMHSELLDLKEKTEVFSDCITQLRSKLGYQQRQMVQHQLSSPANVSLQTQHVRVIRDILREEGDHIATLMKQVTQLGLDTSH